MPECHKCEFNGKANDACLTCVGASEHAYNKGRSHVCIDNITGTDYEPRTFDICISDSKKDNTTSELNNDGAGESNRSVIHDVLHRFLTLTPRQLLVVGMKYQALRTENGRPNFRDIGKELGITKQASRKLFLTAIDDFPELGAMFGITARLSNGLNVSRENNNRRKGTKCRESAKAKTSRCTQLELGI